jgi:hypothetical protein
MTVPVTTDELHENQLQPVPVDTLAGGGQSEILRFVRLPDGAVMLFKRYTAESLLPESCERLGALVRWRRGLGEADRRNLDARAAWVRHVVTNGSGPVGVLITPAASGFWTWKDGKPHPRKIDSIGVPEERARRRKIDYASIPHTVATLGHLLSTLTFLHRRGVTVGDVNRANVLVPSPITPPLTYLLDCDSVLLHGQRSLHPAEAESFRPDDVTVWPDELDRRTDLYKFALMAVGAIGKDMALLDVAPEVTNYLPEAHAELLHRLLDMRLSAPTPDYLDRVVARQWCDYVTPDGAEYIFEPGNLRRLRWTGAASFEHELGPGRSPVAQLPPQLGRPGPWASHPSRIPEPRRPPSRSAPTGPPSAPRTPPTSAPRRSTRSPSAPPGQRTKSSTDWAGKIVATIVVLLLVVFAVSMLVAWVS